MHFAKISKNPLSLFCIWLSWSTGKWNHSAPGLSFSVLGVSEFRGTLRSPWTLGSQLSAVQGAGLSLGNTRTPKNGWVVSHTYKPPQEGFIILLFIPNGQWNCSSVERDSVLSGVSFLHKPRCIFSSFPFFLFCFGRGHFRFTQPSAAESWCLVTPAGAEQKHFYCIYAGLCSDPSLMETS